VRGGPDGACFGGAVDTACNSVSVYYWFLSLGLLSLHLLECRFDHPFERHQLLPSKSKYHVFAAPPAEGVLPVFVVHSEYLARIANIMWRFLTAFAT
jgi:hypothetical protein